MVLNTRKPTNQSTNTSISLIYHLFNFHNILITGDVTGNKLSFAVKAVIVGGMAVMTAAAAATGMAVGTMANGATSDEPGW